MGDIRFEGSIALVDYQGIGERNNDTLMGVFKFKTVMTPIDHLKADRLYRELIGSVNPHLASQEAKNYAFALSQLKYRILESPSFFKNDEIDGGHLDSNVLIELINLAIESEEEYQQHQDDKVKKMQEMLANRIKKKVIVQEDEADDPIEGSEIPEEEIPEIDLGGE